MNVLQQDIRQYTVPEEFSGERLDQVLSRLMPEHSRSRLQGWIRDGHVRVGGSTRRPRDRVDAGERIDVVVPEAPADSVVRAEALPLDVVFEDAHILVVNKPSGLVVHPGAGNPTGTLQNALLHHAPALAAVPRAGLVHRLDKDTSGLLVVAKTLTAHTRLVANLQAREIGREYEALVQGAMVAGGTVDRPIGRHPRDRLRMAVRQGGRAARTHYRVIERFKQHTRLWLQLESGRTHQIRVHMTDIGYPIVGDPLYGGRRRAPAGTDAGIREALQRFTRQALHAARLSLTHPVDDTPMSWKVSPPADMVRLLQILRDDSAGSA